jgi:glycosyltransferase involved in cell wall biosynthesis
VIAPDDFAALSDALERLVDEPELSRRMGEEGRALAERRFDAGRNALQVLEYMHSLA